MKPPARILTIAGSDSGGGAGIQADLKTIAALGGYGMSVITALTAQNGLGVHAIHAPEADFVAAQLDAVLDGFEVSAAKTGMLFSDDIIKALARRLRTKAFPLVVDPVSVSQSGHRLLQDEAVNALVADMLPLADLVTPNRPEAELLAAMDIAEPPDVAKAIDRILDLGPSAVLIKGGHFEGAEMVDWLGLAGKPPVPLPQPRIDTPNTHGTGCTLSAAIATFLGHGAQMLEAVQKAQAYLHTCLVHSYSPGRGFGPVNHMAGR